MFSVVTNKPVEFEKLVRVQNFRSITNHFRRIYKIYLELVKKTPERSQHITGGTWKNKDFDRSSQIIPLYQCSRLKPS
jgi:hypothetical protein